MEMLYISDQTDCLTVQYFRSFRYLFYITLCKMVANSSVTNQCENATNKALNYKFVELQDISSTRLNFMCPCLFLLKTELLTTLTHMELTNDNIKIQWIL